MFKICSLAEVCARLLVFGGAGALIDGVARIRLAGRLALAAVRVAAPLARQAWSLPALKLHEVVSTVIAAEDGTSGMTGERVLAIDVGGTRTKFLLSTGMCVQRLPAALTANLWQDPALITADKFDPAGAPARIAAYLRQHGVEISQFDRLVFAVPGTVDLTTMSDRNECTVVKNTPSMSPRFRGFDFKLAFRQVCSGAKVVAIADGLAGALGVACQNREVSSALVLILGTAPAVATVFRDPSGKGKFIETALWQSWAWFTKVPLDDPYGYCGGLRVTSHGVELKPSTAAKIPHHQAAYPSGSGA